MPNERDIDLTVYPAGDDAAATMLVLPGGGYTTLAPHEAEPIARWLNELGLHAAVLRYTVGSGSYPAALLDARAALRELASGTAGCTPVRGQLGVIGFSAGGHLAAMLATDSADVPGTDAWTFTGRPDAAVLCYPVTDLRETLYGRIPNLIADRLAEILDHPSPELLAHLSPATRVEETTPPLFIWTTADDEVVPALHSLELMTSLALAGVPFSGHVFASGPHGLGLALDQPDVGQWRELCADWLDELGWLP